jgi:hypothetical protein
MPIGKYRGQPVEVLANDRSYCEWLTAQSWFRDQHPNLYAIIINNFAQPNETPEHNQMQVKFLDETWRKKLVVRLLPRTAFTPDGFLNKVQQFEANCHCLVPNEHGGLNLWSLHKGDHGVEPYWIEGTGSSRGPIRQVKVPSSWPVHELAAGEPSFEDDGIDVAYRAWSDESEDWPFTNASLSILLNIEIKPQVGDDFPAILRQINRQREGVRTVPRTNNRGYTSHVREEYQRPGWWVILIRRYEGSVSYEDMCAFMRASSITVVCESEIEATTLPAAISVSATQIAQAMRLPICQQTDLRRVEEYGRDHDTWCS